MFVEIIWNPDRNLFVIPYINHPITWYGFLFALGFLVGFFLLKKIFKDFLESPSKQSVEVELEAAKLTDRLAILVGIGGVVGARLGHVFFYDWPYYKNHLGSILKIWEGGLASHGGVIGAFIALIFFVLLSRKSYPKLTFLAVLDAVTIPAAFAAGCIRIGNFINQEITGKPTNLPWGVIFLHPVDGPGGIPLHPVQLYESFFYFWVFIFLLLAWRSNKKTLGLGELSGWFFLLVFGFRFVIEYLKMPQNIAFDVKGWLTMGQLLSIPFILLGILLIIRHYIHVHVGKKR